MARERPFVHLPQSVHLYSSNRGTGIPIEATWWMVGDRNRWEFGSSTSQSIHWTVPLGSERAKLTATAVFPVPPFPLVIEIIMVLSLGLAAYRLTSRPSQIAIDAINGACLMCYEINA
jgi:hypothetical protein